MRQRSEEGVLRPFHRTVVLLKPQKTGVQCRKDETQYLSPRMTRKLLYPTSTWIDP